MQKPTQKLLSLYQELDHQIQQINENQMQIDTLSKTAMEKQHSVLVLLAAKQLLEMKLQQCEGDFGTINEQLRTSLEMKQEILILLKHQRALLMGDKPSIINDAEIQEIMEQLM